VLISNPEGHYHFLKGIGPYSCGVIADPKYEIIRVTLRRSLPWRQGFEFIDSHLTQQGLSRAAFCAAELRSPAPVSFNGFASFNDDYCSVLRDWDLYVGDLNPVARTNVAPANESRSQVELFAFSYATSIGDAVQPTFVIAGAGEVRDGILEPQSVVRLAETHPEAMREKASYVMGVMEQRLDGLGARWDLVNAIDVYTVHTLEGLVEETILNRLGPARRHGLHYHKAHPPVLDIEFEMDMRGVRSQILV
jgi:hypothetical protein